MCKLAELEGSLWAPPLLSNHSLCGAQALLFWAVIGQGPPVELVCSSFVAPRFHSPLKASLWQDATSAASPSSFTLLRPRTQTLSSAHRLSRPRHRHLEPSKREKKKTRPGYVHGGARHASWSLENFAQQLVCNVCLHYPFNVFRVRQRRNPAIHHILLLPSVLSRKRHRHLICFLKDWPYFELCEMPF